MRDAEMVQISRVQTLLIACAQLTALTTAAAPPISCIHSRTQLASVSAAVASLEAQLGEARRRMVAKELEVRQCELNLTTTSQQRSGEPRPAQRGRKCKIRIALSHWARVFAVGSARREKLEVRRGQGWLQLLFDVPTSQRLCAAAVRKPLSAQFSPHPRTARLAWIFANRRGLHHRGMHGLFCSVRHKYLCASNDANTVACNTLQYLAAPIFRKRRGELHDLVSRTGLFFRLPMPCQRAA